MEDLEYLRDEINKIDKEMIELFEKRAKISRKVAEYKMENSMNILDKSREEEVIKANLKNLKDKSIKDEAKTFLKNVMEISRNIQKREFKQSSKNSEIKAKGQNSDAFKVGFQGVPASFSHEALIEYFGNKSEALNFESFKDVFEALKNGTIKYGVLPIENSSTGGIPQVYDLIGEYDFYIVGEKCIEVNHNLLGVKGASVCDIEEVYSHSQAFMQSSKFFEKHKNWRLIPYFNTARSAQYVSEQNVKSKAAIASKNAAKLYGLDIIEENINYNSNNYTRFIIMGKDIKSDKQCDKISILITLPHKPGTLCNILKYFHENNLNMTKIESRPIINKSWQYFFYIDFDGNIMNKDTRYALKGIEEESVYFKLLGNYKGDCF
ncbi:prephenate dehydratase [Clostridium ljungdahlii]|uniref:Bifunctional chorismate mutase/prephenate dehydratase n=1 Tax=Clostridium ljungdahlii TaxID=1538 RepID=A0A162J8U9_9CLOT|nr:prephenate dehydratase [Clostridium ljungdahlii]OAA91975.1 P-protein [Clostridium ljungdahlii]